jgi:hypothetical protein
LFLGSTRYFSVIKKVNENHFKIQDGVIVVMYEILGSHGGQNDDFGFVDYDAKNPNMTTR